MGAGTRLLLSPGGAQIYYGDEVARPLQIPGAQGDANLRSPMDWSVVATQASDSGSVLEHWRRLGRFRRAHPAVGAGAHRQLQVEPYVFARTGADGADRVVVGLDQGSGEKSLPVGGLFPDGTVVVDAYSGVETTVRGDRVTLVTPFGTVLLARR
jgi:alpha-amylase